MVPQDAEIPPLRPPDDPEPDVPEEAPPALSPQAQPGAMLPPPIAGLDESVPAEERPPDTPQ